MCIRHEKQNARVAETEAVMGRSSRLLIQVSFHVSVMYSSS
jgi:hypothetical protein